MPEPAAQALVFHDELHEQHSAAGHPERPDRVRAIVARLQSDDALRGRITWRAPRDATVAELELVHDPAHVAGIAAIAAAGGGWVDADTYCTPSSFAAGLRASGAAVDALDSLCSGQTTVAFALCRPPGHHATRDTAMGFCLFNNLAVAAAQARTRYGVERIAIVDIDVHHGNGTQDIFWDDPDVLYCSLHRYPFYPGTGAASERGGEGAWDATLNVPLPRGVTGTQWLREFDTIVIPALQRHRPQLLLVSAGFDAHTADPIGDAQLDDATYRMVAERVADVAAEHGEGRSLWALEGGYDLGALGRSASASLQGLLG